ncbi:MAG: alpha-galactosidase [Armatimonadetes bacterium]|nr:alpha-galactosidase [Candidatus Hippobium faecium]
MKFENLRDLPLSFICEGEKITLKNDKIKIGEKGSEGIFRAEEFIFADSIKITAYYKYFEKYDASEWFFRFENVSDVISPVISNILPCDTDMNNDRKTMPLIHYATGGYCSKNDFEPHDGKCEGIFRLWSEGGRSSGRFMPFFNMRLSENNYIFGIGWSGSWEALITADENLKANDLINLKIGMPETEFYLYSGENVRTPKVMALEYKGEIIDGQNRLRRHLFENHNHYKKITGQEELPVFSINWGDAPCDAHVENVKAIVENDLDIDVYWIDASWFGDNPNWTYDTGEWNIRKDKYPNDFKPFRDILEKHNKKFLLWFEPERICKGTEFEKLGDLLIELPVDAVSPRDWGIGGTSPEFPQKENLRNIFQIGDKLINFAKPEAVDFYIKYFTDFIKKHKIDFYRHDANIATAAYFKACDKINRVGITEMKWVEGLYRFWDSLIENCPGLVIDNCSSGGRRIDLEMMDRSIFTTRTDCVWNEDWKQSHGLGLNEWCLNHTCTEGVRLRGDNLKNFDYDLVSNLSLGIMLNLSFEIKFGKEFDHEYFMKPENYDFPKIKDALKKYRKLQPYFKYDYYPLTSYSWRDDAICAYEFYSPEEDKGMIVLIKRENCPVESASFELKGIKDRDYKFDYVIGNYDLKLENRKLSVKFGDKHTACCVTF